MSAAAPRLLASLASGSFFGLGLALSGMLDPSRVRGFLDVFGAWDPTLAFVLAGAVIVATIGFRLVGRRATPLLAPRFDLPAARQVDAPLVGGAAFFGIGWALSGYCPGPAVASLTFAGAPAIVVVAAMLIGMLAFEAWRRRPAEPATRTLAAGEQSQ
jgi:uncharacterized protein